MKNIYKCPKKIWNKFSPTGKAIYNMMRDTDYESVMPAKLHIDDREFEILSHNFACVAAWNTENYFDVKA